MAKDARKSWKGQTLAEYAVILPIMALLFYGIYMAAMYAYRAAQADYGVFLTGVATGSYKTPATELAKKAVTSEDLRASIKARIDGADPQTTFTARSQINVEATRLSFLGVNFVEAQKGGSVFRLWRFRPGKPKSLWE